MGASMHELGDCRLEHGTSEDFQLGEEFGRDPPERRIQAQEPRRETEESEEKDGPDEQPTSCGRVSPGGTAVGPKAVRVPK